MTNLPTRRPSLVTKGPEGFEGDVYGPATQAVVQDFRRRTEINPSGIVGPKTWNALYSVVGVSGGWGC